MKNIVIVGATSAIATACARNWAEEGERFVLIARNTAHLEQVAADLDARGAAHVTCCALDINDVNAHAAALDQCVAELGTLDIVLLAPGTLPDQTACERDASLAMREFQTNALSLIAFMTPLANLLEAQRSGTLAVISSVAGDRGRPSNYVYGSAKAALSTFCDGLRARLFKAGVHVLTIKPGFVDTPMTAGLPLPKMLVATPQHVAAEISRAIDTRRNVLYTPWFWVGIMAVIRSLPEFMFKRASL